VRRLRHAPRGRSKSRKAYPKQFSPLLHPGRESLYQMTLARFAAEGFAAPLVMTGDAFRFLATDQAADLGCGRARGGRAGRP
jgi:mannose-1-phosphate guanylyltransferase/mannose-6-phosphate isomerase